MFELFKKLLFSRQIEMERGSLTLLGQKMVILPAWTFVYLQKSTPDRKLMNKYIYYGCKLADVKGFTRGIHKKYGLKHIKLAQWMADIAMLGGWGEFEIIKFRPDEKIGIFHVKNSPVALQFGYSKDPVDHAIRGFIAGAAELQLQRSTDAIETKCQAKGDEFCEFIAKPTEKFNLKDPLVRSQLDIKGNIIKEIKKISKK